MHLLEGVGGFHHGQREDECEDHGDGYGDFASMVFHESMYAVAYGALPGVAVPFFVFQGHRVRSFLCDKRKPPTNVGGFRSLRVCGLLLVGHLLIRRVVALGDGGACRVACDGSLEKCREVDAQ